MLALVVWFHASLPWWVILPVGAYFAALHASLQHEVLHGHRTAEAFARYLEPMVRRAEYARRFKDDGSGLDKLLDAMARQGAAANRRKGHVV